MVHLHIVQLISKGGVSSMIFDLSTETAKNGVETVIIPLTDLESNVYPDLSSISGEVKVMEPLYNKLYSMVTFIRLRRVIKNYTKNNDCVIFMHLKVGVLFGIMSSLMVKGVKKIEVYHSHYSNYKFMLSVLKHFTHRYIAVSKEARLELIRNGVNCKKIDVVYNGVKLSLFNTKKSVDYANLKFISVGRLSYEKGFVLSSKVFNNILKKYANVSYTLIGDGPEYQECNKFANSKQFEMTGELSRFEVIERLQLSDVVVLPSLFEGNSILLLEALAAGKCLVFSDIESFREVFNLEKLNSEFGITDYGIQFEVGNVNSLEQSIDYLINNKDIIYRIQKNCRDLSKIFSLQNQARRYIEVSYELFKGGRYE